MALLKTQVCVWSPNPTSCCRTKEDKLPLLNLHPFKEFSHILSRGVHVYRFHLRLPSWAFITKPQLTLLVSVSFMDRFVTDKKKKKGKKWTELFLCMTHTHKSNTSAAMICKILILQYYSVMIKKYDKLSCLGVLYRIFITFFRHLSLGQLLYFQSKCSCFRDGCMDVLHAVCCKWVLSCEEWQASACV